jgi:hypothetical protein
MAINLAINLGVPVGVVSNQISYARIDNLPAGQNPVYTTVVPNVTSFPAVIATNIPNGQYIVSALPIYADGRKCQPTTQTTPACPGLISISATIQGGVLVVTYVAPSSAPSVLITVNYPNGGSFSQTYTNTGNPISIGLPAGVFGNYTVFGQSVCDPTSGFYSPPSASVTVNYAQSIPGSYYLGNSSAAACAAPVRTLYTNGAPVAGVSFLYQDQALTTPTTGYTFAIYSGIIYNLNSTTGQLGTDTGLTCFPTVIVRNALSFITMSAVTGIPGFVFTPTTGTFYQQGNHGAFTGSIVINWNGTVPASPPFNIQVYKNGVLISGGCYNYPTGAGSASFAVPSTTFLATDIIEIDSGTGSC